jgi:hypothetical protein
LLASSSALEFTGSLESLLGGLSYSLWQTPVVISAAACFQYFLFYLDASLAAIVKEMYARLLPFGV